MAQSAALCNFSFLFSFSFSFFPGLSGEIKNRNDHLQAQNGCR